MGRVLSANLGRNLDMAVKWPIKHCTSFTFVGLRISIMALHFSGFASIPHCVSMKPKNFPLSTPNRLFSGLSLRMCFRSDINTSTKSFECYRWLADLVTMLSTYTSTHLPIRWLNTLSISLL